MTRTQKLPIGIFDSGLGGLSLVPELRKKLPNEDLLYLADQANLPYGEKSQQEIEVLTDAAVPTLITEGAKVVLIACNSASVSIIERLRKRYPPTPFVAIVPMIKPAVERTKTGAVAVFATRTTLKSRMYQSLKEQYANNVRVLDIACPSWAPMVESGQIRESELRRPVKAALSAGADQLVLGCTHYPFLSRWIRKAAGPADILDSGPAVARQIARILTANGQLAEKGPAMLRCLTSGDPDYASRRASALLNRPVRFSSVGR